MKRSFRLWSMLALIVLVSLFVSSCSSGGGGDTSGDSFKAAIVTDTAGLGDQSFNDQANRGLERAKAELSIGTQVYETSQPSDYEPSLAKAPAQGNNITFGVGFLMTDALINASAQNPDAKYAIIDSVVEGDNVVSINFKEEEGSFLVGAVAGLMTKSNKVGFIGGLEVPLIKKFEAGFQAGVMTVNPDAEVLVTYAGSFNDPGKGKEIALSQYADGADVIYHASGGTGIGMFQAAQEKGEGFWAVGVDSDQYELAPDNVLTSMMKRVDTAVYETIKNVKEGNFKSGITVFGLKEDGVGLSPTTDKNTPQDVIDKANALGEKIIAGEFTVPTTDEELESFTPPQ
ncbi:BMP family ABC transporter substrate-binding protein, partial [Anaerolineales bacterium HSG24]|nr:BMP family ABC transporter substrate-binding protein [Anaerolineales bacterium HSG24]